ncbi:MAG: UDP-N-acetylmuramoyl-L-alanine--D-glutamate ligase [Burkholderiales bacterium]|nr:UDP-N-acetylmuramoyl-L-alanine--D-glutamate ligase [Burkholderiales bacterium]
MNHAGRKVLVLGLGVTGLSMVRWLVRAGARVHVGDTRAAPPCLARLRQELPQVQVSTGAFSAALFEDIDLIALSPGLPMNEPPVSEARARGVPVVGDIELFAHALPLRRATRIVAITGSNGKSTVTEMAGAMCRAAGLDTVVAGNIGLPVLDALQEMRPDAATDTPIAFVLELSSFQLEATSSLNAHVAACLNLSEDHLDRYAGMPEYARAKARIFRGDGVQVVNRQDEWTRGMILPARRVFTFGLDAPGGADDWGLVGSGTDMWLAQGSERLMPVSRLRVTGLHNAANALAALALLRAVDLPYPTLLEALSRFEGLPHRVQKVAEIDGITFYDDSKGTNVGATVAALNGMRQKVVLIAGGDGKGQDFSPLRQALMRQARALVLIGRDAERIAEAVEGVDVPMLRARDMDEAVRAGHEQAREGDAVLLSPACASFDMFRNYEHRAQVFVQAVNKLVAHT